MPTQIAAYPNRPIYRPKPEPYTGYYAEQDRLRAMEVDFLDSFGLREFENTARNVARLLQSGGASRADAKRVSAMLGAHGAYQGAFDHGRLFGSGGEPRMLVGHPYGLEGIGGYDDPAAQLGAIRSLGLVVIVGPPEESFYGFGTSQVLVVAPGLCRPVPIASGAG